MQSHNREMNIIIPKIVLSQVFFLFQASSIKQLKKCIESRVQVTSNMRRNARQELIPEHQQFYFSLL